MAYRSPVTALGAIFDPTTAITRFTTPLIHLDTPRSAVLASLFTHSGGLQAIAAHGPVSLQVHTGQIDILADDSVTVTSVNGDIEVKARQKIVLYCDGAAITLDGPNITLSGNEITVKALIHGFGGPGQGAFNVENLPDGTVQAVNVAPPGAPEMFAMSFDEAFILKSELTGKPVAHRRYRIIRENGTIEEGVTNEQGMTHLVKSDRLETLQIEIGEEEIV